MRVRYIPIALCFCLFAFPLVLVADDYYIQWADTIDNGSNDIAEGVAVDNSNNIIVTGYSSIGGNHDYFTVNYDSNGTIQWADTIDNGGYDWAYGVAVDNSNNIIVTGSSEIGSDKDYFTVKYVPTSGVSEDEGSDILSNNPVLDDIYPNPFTTTTTIILSSSSSELQAASCKLNIYDVSGRLVNELLLPTSYSPLATEVSWDGRDEKGKSVKTGVYFMLLKSGNFATVKKITLVR